ncbi:MAG: molybdopterin dinucleotide binding domain-containing protein, partial [Myxococcota bacterium]
QGQQRDEATIYLDLADACDAPIHGSRMAQTVLNAARAVNGFFFGRRSVPQELLLDLILRATGQASFNTLLGYPHGLTIHTRRERSFLGERVVTHDAKVHLAPTPLLRQAEQLESAFERQRILLEDKHHLRLITKRQITTHNSWTHNIDDFVRKGTNHLWMHPSDAERLGLTEGALADVRSATATVRVPIATTADLMPGVVALPHGWGHQHARGLSVASRTHGVNANLLAADGPDNLERVSGMAHLTGIPVQIAPADGPQDTSSWSGLPLNG